ncbi:MAG: hypothetical protein IJK52_09325, partial [Oscillospiraceae bacterium]|nr:hypothetical protein [Oscillospiraceae bacterium]
MRKRIFALLCALSICLSVVPAAFALEGEAQRAADTLVTLGLLGETDLDMSQPADRLTAVVTLTVLSGAPDADSAKPFAFSDVPDWAENRVAYALRQGWTTASSETAFGSDLPVSANEWFTMLARMLGYREADADFTSANAAAFARRIGLCSRAYTGMMAFGDLCES